jgi:hypothetical protein
MLSQRTLGAKWLRQYRRSKVKHKLKPFQHFDGPTQLHRVKIRDGTDGLGIIAFQGSSPIEPREIGSFTECAPYLDFQLKQHGVSHVIAVGLLANTCIESTSRFAMELGYHVTLMSDATAAFSHEMMHAGASPERADLRPCHPDDAGVARQAAWCDAAENFFPPDHIQRRIA